MPVSFNEPLSALQKMAEDLEYSFLLDEAAPFTGVDRMIKVAAFALSCYAAEATRRGRKPFNPIMGETYELIREDLGWKFISEQVHFCQYLKMLSPVEAKLEGYQNSTIS